MCYINKFCTKLSLICIAKYQKNDTNAQETALNQGHGGAG
ncbi:hypothetical protein yaldo0001_39360 [Yersinia aldovae ATCC 35236]|nr:hypothetical protein yaldo0001_39360 [Yersinia aldovae ATCC 35236]